MSDLNRTDELTSPHSLRESGKSAKKEKPQVHHPPVQAPASAGRMDDPALMIGFTILVWCRDSGLVPCWLLHAVSPVTLSFASAASRDATRGGIIGVYFQYKKRLFSIQHIIMYHYHDAMVQNRRGYYPRRRAARRASRERHRGVERSRGRAGRAHR